MIKGAAVILTSRSPHFTLRKLEALREAAAARDVSGLRLAPLERKS